jgi:Ni/Co efflux regulator RcnB
MKKLLALTYLPLLAFAAAAPVFAQHASYHYQPARHNAATRSSETKEDPSDRDNYAEGSPDSGRRTYTYTRHEHSRDRNRYAPYRYRATVRYVYPNGNRPGDWTIGSHLPSSYYSHGNYVDFRRYGLIPPPSGFQWVRIDQDVYLVAPDSGLIRDVIYELFY